jgi:hypothetical protein
MKILLSLTIAIYAPLAWSSDACSTLAIYTRADVVVSDNSIFTTESYFQSSQAAAIRHIRENQQIIVAEGPFSWIRIADESRLGSEFHRGFALGHQYHALLLHFDEIVTNPRQTEQIAFRGGNYQARSGDFPNDGVVHLIDGVDPQRAAGFIFEFPDDLVISVSLSDWRQVGERELPFNALIDDGERTFDYRYTSVVVEPRSPLWFLVEVGTPAIDEVQAYRQQRSSLAAQCGGDPTPDVGHSGGQIQSARSKRIG